MEANPRYLRTPRAVRWMHARRRPVIGWGLGAPRRRGVGRSARGGPAELFGPVRRAGRLQPPGRRAVPPGRDCPRSGSSWRPTRSPPARPSRPRNDRTIFAGGQATLLFVGRLQARKRIDLLLHACAALPADCRPRLWVVGDGPARAELEDPGPGRSIPRPNSWARSTAPSWNPIYLAADLFVLPGTGGLAVQQAMGYALPVIVAEGDGTQSDLVRAGNGWQVTARPAGRAGETAWHEALADPGRLRRMGNESYRIVRDEINLEKMVEVFAEVGAERDLTMDGNSHAHCARC